MTAHYPGWLAGMIQEMNCGYTVEPESSLEFAKALEHAADNRDGLVEMGVNARLLAEREFDRKLLADKWVSWVVGSEADNGVKHEKVI